MAGELLVKVFVENDISFTNFFYITEIKPEFVKRNLDSSYTQRKT